MIERWTRCRAAIEGEDAIREGKETYCPKPTGLEADEFKRYLQRASWYGATQRTIDAMTGLIFRKDPDVMLPDALYDLEESASANGQSLLELADFCVEEVLGLGRLGILVDFPQVENAEQQTVAQAEAVGARPYLATYTTENIVNWRWRSVGARRVLGLVVLREFSVQPDPEDYFKEESVEQYRELALDEQGFYFQRVWVKEDNEWIPGPQNYPVMNSAPMTFIPFYAATPNGDDVDSLLPPLIDLVDLNIKHWINSAGYEHGVHFTCNPMPVITGWSPPAGTTITIGSERCLVLDDPQAKAFYMEFGGAGLDRADKAMAKKEKQMAVLGSRLLLEQTKGVEAAETAAIHRAGENSILGSVAQSVSKVLTRAYKVMVEWSGADAEDVQVQLNTDFLPFALEPATITALMNAWQAGVISKRTLFQKLQEGEAIPPGVDFDADQELIDEESMDDVSRNIPQPAQQQQELPVAEI